MTTYELVSVKTQGDFTLEYDAGGCLITCKLAFKQSLPSQALLQLLFHKIPYKESDIGQLEKIGFKVAKAVPANMKIALFCRYYENYKSIKYKVSPSDSGKIKGIKIDDVMLTAYFGSDSFIFKDKHSIGNLVKYYNELRAEIASGGKNKHPNRWDEAYFKKLPSEQYGEYWEHLRGLGLTPHKDGRGNTVDWIKKGG
ncbi:MAG: hypothetical protein EOO42_01050 [Flavobacteriales bacterium]|nr:MAG: hypothetical protein EOO42_01050 [Flavobacteriales bacterium]